MWIDDTLMIERRLLLDEFFRNLRISAQRALLQLANGIGCSHSSSTPNSVAFRLLLRLAFRDHVFLQHVSAGLQP
jgi:hypothetical protein